MAKTPIVINASKQDSGVRDNLSMFDELPFTTKYNIETMSNPRTGAVTPADSPVVETIGSTNINGYLPLLTGGDFFFAESLGGSPYWHVKNSSTGAYPDSIERMYTTPGSVKAGTKVSKVTLQNILGYTNSIQSETALTLSTGFVNTDGTVQTLGSVVLTGSSEILAGSTHSISGVEITAATDSRVFIKIKLDDGGSTDANTSVIRFDATAGNAILLTYLTE